VQTDHTRGQIGPRSVVRLVGALMPKPKDGVSRLITPLHANRKLFHHVHRSQYCPRWPPI